jgi:hypothetical protein
VPLAFYPLYGWNSVLIAGALRAAALMTATGFVNSVCHKWGSRAKDSRGHEFRADDSRNNSFVAVVAGGEGNHSWHHADPACPRHGRRVVLDAEAVAAGARPERGWHPDLTWRLIQILAMLVLIYRVKKPKVKIHFADKQLMPSLPLRETRLEWHLDEPPAMPRKDRLRLSAMPLRSSLSAPAPRRYGPELPDDGGVVDASASRACSRARISSGV